MASRSMSISPPPTKRKRRESSNSNSNQSTTTTTPPANELSIYTWNINGIQPFLQKPITSFFKKSAPPSRSATSPIPIPTASLRAFLRRHNWPTLLLLQEVKINPSDSATMKAVESAVRRPPNCANEPDYTASFNLPSDPHNARGFGRKIYGVCSIARRDWSESANVAIRTVDWDLEGRIQVLETHPPAGSNLPGLSIWNIYAVNGTANAYKSPSTGEVVGTRHDRKLAFHSMLLDECLRLQKEGYEVVLAGDMNVARGVLDGYPNLRTAPEEHIKNREDFNSKFFEDEQGFRGVDVFRKVHGDRRAYSYYPRGRTWGESCDRVDLIICSKGLRDCISEADILDSPAERGPSDHVPLFASFTFGETSRKSRKLENDDG